MKTRRLFHRYGPPCFFTLSSLSPSLNTSSLMSDAKAHTAPYCPARPVSRTVSVQISMYDSS